MEAEQYGLDIYEMSMKGRNNGLYKDGIIWINNKLSNTEKACVLAEEIGHHFTSSGNILNQKDIWNCKQERKARIWAYERLVPLPKIVQALREGVSNHYEMAEFLDVTVDFVKDALKRYQEKYGPYVKVENYTLRFDPLCILELLE